MVREAVEETLIRMIDTEANELCKATCYELNEKRVDKSVGYYKRNLETIYRQS